MRKCRKMLTGYSFCLALTEECQMWLRCGSCVWSEGEREGNVREKGGKGIYPSAKPCWVRLYELEDRGYSEKNRRVPHRG